MTTHVMTENLATEATTRSARTAGRHAMAPATGNGMNGALPTGANQIVHARVLSRGVDALQAKFAQVLDDGLIRRTVHAAYRELNRTARLKTYLPTLALNRAETRLREIADRTAAAGTPEAETLDGMTAAA
ncbi:three-helix bundle dimerization domain-containing protein [Citricoccus alkalitolerans]|uniref:Three-helix bundle dimerization domain-containing protein n=1 Tax=Citricoccus alkalitolerans TaxID=246603 RepID=A0ABV8XWS6_9MICC